MTCVSADLSEIILLSCYLIVVSSDWFSAYKYLPKS